MRVARFSIANQVKYGTVKDDLVSSLSRNPFDSFETGAGFEFDGQNFSLADVKLMAPCMPSKIVCLAVNYRSHAREMHDTPTLLPHIFLKPSTAVLGPDGIIVLPRNWKRVDFEAELAVVIGKKARFVAETEAKQYIMGYTCFNDVTERQLQKEEGQWERSKIFDTFAPMGPWIETEVEPDDLKIETLLNGEIRQSAWTSDLIHGVAKLVSFISETLTLLPGDVIATGTPAGISPLNPGDVVEVQIENIGILRNTVAAPQ